MKCPKEVSSFEVRFSVKVQDSSLPFLPGIFAARHEFVYRRLGVGVGVGIGVRVGRRLRLFIEGFVKSKPEPQKCSGVLGWPAIISKAVDRSLRATIARVLKMRAIKPNARRIQIWQTTPASA